MPKVKVKGKVKHFPYDKEGMKNAKEAKEDKKKAKGKKK